MSPLKFLIIGLSSGFLFWPTFRGMAETWISDPNYSHCFFVPVIAAAILWKNRRAWLGLPQTPSPVGLFVFILSMLAFAAGAAGGLKVVERVAMVVAVHGAGLYYFGKAAYKKMAFPLAFLFLMIPIPETLHGMISFPLQLLATKYSATVLEWMTIPVQYKGNLLYFPQGALEVIEACSGIRSLFAFVTLAVLLAYWNRETPFRSGVLILSAIPLALGANVLRIAASGVIATAYGMEAGRGFFHDFSGYALFLFGLLLFLFEIHALRNIVRKSGS